MNKSKFLSIAITTFLVVGCTSLNELNQNLQVEPSTANTSTIQANNKATKSKGSIKGWEFKVKKVKSEGQLIDEGYIKYEAAEAWILVSINVRNTSNKRQNGEKAIASIAFAELFDSQGNKYENPKFKFNSSNNSLSKPFSSGETRSFDLLFDAPKGIETNHLLINTSIIDVEGDSIRLKL